MFRRQRYTKNNHSHFKKEEQGESKTALRLEFIGMAFAVAVGQVGLEVGDFYNGHSASDEHMLKHFYVFTHLLLGTFVIASSWVGWQRSKSEAHLQPIRHVFSIAFLLLLIDLFLVTCYFIIVKTVERPYSDDAAQRIITVNPELFWSEVSFATYIVWDFFSKPWELDSFRAKIYFRKKKYFPRMWQACACLALLLLFQTTVSKTQTETTVIVGDIYIIATFALFRGMKEEIESRGKHPRIVALKYLFYRGIPAMVIVGYFVYHIITLSRCFRPSL